MTTEGEALRREFLAIGGGRGRKFPEHLRERGGAFIAAQLRAGRSFGWVAQALGVSEQTVRRWVRDGAGKRTLLPVEVAEDSSAETVSSPVLVSPQGYRVEGLSLEQIALVLREVG